MSAMSAMTARPWSELAVLTGEMRWGTPPKNVLAGDARSGKPASIPNLVGPDERLATLSGYGAPGYSLWGTGGLPSAGSASSIAIPSRASYSSST